MTKPIVIIGSANTDMITRVKKIPKPGETVLGGTFMTAQGGKGANQAVAASRAHGKVKFIASLGNDSFGEQAIQQYTHENIDISHMVRDPKLPSGVALIFVAEDGENAIAVASGANANLLPKHIEHNKAVIESAEIILLQLETPIETIEKSVAIAHAAGVPIILNPAPAQMLEKNILKKITYLTPNKHEAGQLSGVPINDSASAEKAATALLESGVNHVIITLGDQGALVATSERMNKVPCRHVKAVDTTAAGDTFNGALAVALSEKKSLLDAVAFANTAAALSVTQVGAQPSIPTRSAIDLLLADK